MQTKTLRRLAALVIASGVALAAPAAAHAALTAESDGGTKTVTITGDDAPDTLVVNDNGTKLTHNIPVGGLESATDFDTDAGVQEIDADETWQVVIQSGGGDDSITVLTPKVLRVIADLGAGDDVFHGSVATAGKT